ncbi:MAG TPA: glycosyltransferase family 4 protein [Candidatus Methylomirabilis sp.]|nr:glycosyltransferase family 4 protein [Candidatus Methylomirabilis sp.]
MGYSKRLLFVITQAEWGGVQSYVWRAAQEARQRGFEVLVCAGGTGELEKRCHESNIPYRRLLRIRRNIAPFADIGAVGELVGLMREWKPDIAYLHSSKAGIVGSIAARIARRAEGGANVPRVVYRIGGWSFLDPVSSVQKAVRRWSEQISARLKDVIIVLHPGDEELAMRYRITPRDRLIMIPNGLDLTAFDASLLPRDEARAIVRGVWRNGVPSGATVPETAPLLLTIANFYPTKNLTMYLNAISIARKRIPDLRAIVIGDGEERAALEAKRHALGLDEIVSFPGAHADASALLKGAEAFVLPSAKEGMPWTLLEAMAAALPCIVTDVGANRWMIGEAGAVVPPNDPTTLADAIVRALADSERARSLGRRARTTVESRFTDRAMWEATFSLFR